MDYRNNTWCGPRFLKENKARALLTGVEGDVFLDHEGNLVSVDDGLCARSWLARHPEKIEIIESSGGSSHHTKIHFFFAKIMIFLDF